VGPSSDAYLFGQHKKRSQRWLRWRS
jgi:hypothetical protein